ncbi:MAG: redoxin domain-containing protein [Actinomycetota bacterium]|nr:redoxin domain-containing protein [Actinomycetota bacterium]
MFTRTRTEPVPEVGAEAPEFNLPSAQGGQLRLSMRTVRGPVVIASYRPGDEEDVEYFKALAGKEEEINLAAGSLVGVGVAEPHEARDFVRATGMKSYVLYDYARAASRDWGLLQRDRKRGDYTARAVFVVGPDHKVAHAWTGERPKPEEILAKVSEITGLPKPAEEKSERPKKAAEGDGEKTGEARTAEAPKKLSAEERERIKAERRAAREAGKSLKTPAAPAPEGEAPKKLSAEERERIKAERRAAREAGKSVKTDAAPAPQSAEAAESGDKPAKMSAEERERIKAERRAAREAGRSLKQPAAQPEQAPPAVGAEDTAVAPEATGPPEEETREE